MTDLSVGVGSGSRAQLSSGSTRTAATTLSMWLAQNGWNGHRMMILCRTAVHSRCPMSIVCSHCIMKHSDRFSTSMLHWKCLNFVERLYPLAGTTPSVKPKRSRCAISKKPIEGIYQWMKTAKWLSAWRQQFAHQCTVFKTCFKSYWTETIIENRHDSRANARSLPILSVCV